MNRYKKLHIFNVSILLIISVFIALTDVTGGKYFVMLLIPVAICVLIKYGILNRYREKISNINVLLTAVILLLTTIPYALVYNYLWYRIVTFIISVYSIVLIFITLKEKNKNKHEIK